MPTLLSAAVSLTHFSNYLASGMFLNSGSKFRYLASLHRLLWGRVRRLHRYYQGTLTPYDSSRRTSFPSIGDTSVGADSVSARSHPLADSLWSPGLFRDGTRKPQGLSSSRESSIVRSHSFQRPRSDLSLQTSYGGSGIVPGSMKAETLTFSNFSRLNSEAFGLTVYASP